MREFPDLHCQRTATKSPIASSRSLMHPSVSAALFAARAWAAAHAIDHPMLISRRASRHRRRSRATRRASVVYRPDLGRGTAVHEGRMRNHEDDATTDETLLSLASCIMPTQNTPVK
ncbi:hypothetical protein EVAR_103324_1 [Eumeta japonica]|uniref:Uncharacterized protein n=1 Tax=Eumeta variegata TaxID=151549 RepID=A0A4C1Z8I5_EUMVA|nr:hypothetical protein EVAR_103324_1 [Eumeta japonica]